MSAADLARLGVDAKKVPSAAALRSQLHALVDAPPQDAKASYLVWLVDGRAVGFNSLKRIVFGVRGDMHLHMWDGGLRGKGFGGTLFCLAALEFFERFRLKEIVCEPSRGNPAPNEMLRRVGFRLIGTRVGASSDLSLVTDLNTFAIERDVAHAYLRRATPGPL